jgi:hypothetical protein
MLYSVAILLGILSVLYVAHLLIQSYSNETLSWEPFKQQPIHGDVSKDVNPVPSLPIPSLPERNITPSGPSPPNAQSSSNNVDLVENVRPSDTMDDVNSETPIRDNLRHPENSFGPGVENNGTRMSVESGVASNTVRGGVSNFSPEFAQNGGEFMEGISASDAFMTDNYSSI